MVEATAEELLEFLIDSARYGDTEDVALAIKEKVHVDGQDDVGRTGGYFDLAACCHWLDRQTSDTSYFNLLCIAALHMASANGHVAIVKLLLQADAVGTCAGSSNPQQLAPDACTATTLS